MEPKIYMSVKPHLLSLGFLSKCQHKLIKGLVVNIDNCFNEVFPSFDPLNSEFVPRVRIINTFLVIFHFTCLANAIKTVLNPEFNNLMKWLLSLQIPPPLLLLSQMLASRTTLLLLSHIFISTTSP